MKLYIYIQLEKLFSLIENKAENMRQYFSICPDCLQNRYKGKTCIKN